MTSKARFGRRNLRTLAIVGLAIGIVGCAKKSDTAATAADSAVVKSGSAEAGSLADEVAALKKSLAEYRAANNAWEQLLWDSYTHVYYCDMAAHKTNKPGQCPPGGMTTHTAPPTNPPPK